MNLSELTARYGKMRCDCPAARIDDARTGTLLHIASDGGSDRVKCVACGTIYRFIGVLVKDKWQQEVPAPKDLTKSNLPLSVIKIKPSDTRK